MKVTEIFAQMEASKDINEFLQTGFLSLDQHLDGGFLRKELIVLGGHTGIGKSYVAGQIMYNIAKQGFKTAYLSLEISNMMVLSRLIGAIANIKPTRISYGLLNSSEYDDKTKAKTSVELYEDFMDFFDNKYEFEEIKKTIKDGQYEFVVIDFIQNVFLKNTDEYTRMSQVALELQKLAKELNCCILVLSQLSNAAARSGEKGVIEYKGSGSIATVCDLGFIIDRSDSEGEVNLVNLMLKKNRRGISGSIFSLLFRMPGGWLS